MPIGRRKGINMKYEITKNETFGSYEIKFDGKPSEAVRDALKGCGYRWHGKRAVWYGYRNDIREILESFDDEEIREKIESEIRPVVKVDREMLREQYAKAWQSDNMINYCVKKVSTYAILPGGEIVTVDKVPIETSFCFGESGYDYDDATHAAAHARTSQEYFKRENMKHFERWIDDLEKLLSGESDYRLAIGPRQYTGQADDCRLVSVSWFRLSDVIASCGGSCYLDELPGKTIDYYGTPCRIATNDEIEAILTAYREAAAAHEKRVDVYLKKYGLSNVHSWNYWREA